MKILYFTALLIILFFIMLGQLGQHTAEFVQSDFQHAEVQIPPENNSEASMLPIHENSTSADTLASNSLALR